MRDKGIDYFENSRRATYVQRSYAIDNPLKFEGYCHCLWGITASDGPGPVTLKVNGIEREFFDYVARGVPFGPDDGTIAPLGSGRVIAVRARNRAARDRALHTRAQIDIAPSLRIQSDFQSDLSR
jgi:hypothetical protein